MWSSRLFWKLFTSYALLNLTATVTFVVIVTGWQAEQVNLQVRERLHDSAAMVRRYLSEDISQGRTTALQNAVLELGEDMATRITIVAMNGEVLADSKRESLAAVAKMDNHKGRPELVKAASSGYGTSQRESPSIGEPMLYVAIRADSGEEPLGMVRTALPMTQVRSEIAAVQRLIWIVALIVSIAVVGLTYFVAVRLVRPVSTLTNAAEAIAAGDYQHRVYLHSRDELGVLARSFNHMSDKLDSREAQLRDSTKRLATVLEGMVEGVIALDDQHRIILANPAAGRLLSFDPVESEQKPIMQVVRNHTIHEMLQGPEQPQGTRRVEIQSGDEQSRSVGVTATFLAGESPTRCILVLQDITELRKLEAMRQEFVANVSHELKTPLSSIKAYSETLLSGAINDANNNSRFVLRIEEQAERLHELILDMLSLARIESGQQAFDIVNVRVADVVEDCFAEAQASADSKGIQLITNDSPQSLEVRADEEGARQILNNLISNAVKYTPEGGEVGVEWSRTESTVVVKVRDTGIGISAEHLPRVFERFYRVDKARSRELGGTGLGLSIVKHLAQSFGGTVDVESQPGKGSTFAVSLPRA